MKTIIIFSIIIVALLGVWLGNRFFQKIIRPRESVGRLLLYFLTCLVMVFIACFIMVYTITRLYPGELLK